MNQGDSRGSGGYKKHRGIQGDQRDSQVYTEHYSRESPLHLDPMNHIYFFSISMPLNFVDKKPVKKHLRI